MWAALLGVSNAPWEGKKEKIFEHCQGLWKQLFVSFWNQDLTLPHIEVTNETTLYRDKIPLQNVQP